MKIQTGCKSLGLNWVYSSSPPTCAVIHATHSHRLAGLLGGLSKKKTAMEDNKAGLESTGVHKICHKTSHGKHLRLMIQQVEFHLETLAVMVELTADSVPITADELEKLSASSGLARFAPPGSFPVSDLVAGDLPVLAVQGRGLPPKHDALGGVGGWGIKHKRTFSV